MSVGVKSVLARSRQSQTLCSECSTGTEDNLTTQERYQSFLFKYSNQEEEGGDAVDAVQMSAGPLRLPPISPGAVSFEGLLRAFTAASFFE